MHTEQDIFFMSDISREEVKALFRETMEPQIEIINQKLEIMGNDLINKLEMIEASLMPDIDKGIKSWMAEVELKQEHILFLRDQYKYYMGRQTQVRKIVIGIVVTAIIVGSFGYAKNWATEQAVKIMEKGKSGYAAPPNP